METLAPRASEWLVGDLFFSILTNSNFICRRDMTDAVIRLDLG